jgi:hypothetical protein
MQHRPYVLLFASFSLLVMFCLAVVALTFVGLGKLDAVSALQVRQADEIPARGWLAGSTENACTKDPCLVVEHLEDEVRVTITTFHVDPVRRQDRLRTTAALVRSDNNVKLSIRHFATPDYFDELSRIGVDLSTFHEPETLYEVTGWGPWTNATIELPHGVLPQFFFNGFRNIDRAMGNQTDVDELTMLAEVAANEVSDRFGLVDLASRATVVQIASGPIQSLTYVVGLLALLFTTFEIWAPSVKRFSDGIADLIPFTGFFGTLIGVAGGLQVLGQSDVTDDVSKALSLGKIGSSLGLAINTTILAIVVFGLVLVLQYFIRLLILARDENRHQVVLDGAGSLGANGGDS